MPDPVTVKDWFERLMVQRMHETLVQQQAWLDRLDATFEPGNKLTIRLKPLKKSDA